MANHRSAQKRIRQTVKRTERNINIRSRTRSAVRKFREALTAGDKSVLETAFAAATHEIRRAASKGVFHARTASRRVSRLHVQFNAANK